MEQDTILEEMSPKHYFQAKAQLDLFFGVKEIKPSSKILIFIIVHYFLRPFRFFGRFLKEAFIITCSFIHSTIKKILLIPSNKSVIVEDKKNIVLVRGEWGVGKTTFIKNYFDKNEYVKERYNPIYVDLFGLRNIDELNKKVIESISVTRSKGSSTEKNINLYARATVSNKLTGLSASFEIGINLSKKINKKKEYNLFVEKENSIYRKVRYKFYKEPVLILDDIERKTKELSLEAIIGFVDIFKKQGIKVILITNEQQLLLHEKEMYHLLDRVVDYDISLRLSKDDISSFVNTFQLDYCGKVLLDKELFNLIIDTSHTSNLRTYKKFSMLLCDIKCDYSYLDKFLLNIILLCLINKNEGKFDYSYLIDMLAFKKVSFPGDKGYLSLCEEIDNKYANIKNNSFKVFKMVIDNYIKDILKIKIKDQGKIIEQIYWSVDRGDIKTLSEMQIEFEICPLLDYANYRFEYRDDSVLVRNKMIWQDEITLLSYALKQDYFSKMYILYYYCYLLESLNGNYSEKIDKLFEASIDELAQQLISEAEKEFFDNKWNYSFYKYSFYLSNQDIISTRKNSVEKDLLLRLIGSINKKFKISHKNEHDCYETLSCIERVIDLLFEFDNGNEFILEKIDHDVYKQIIIRGDKLCVDYLLKLCNNGELKTDVLKKEVVMAYNEVSKNIKIDKYVRGSFEHQFHFGGLLVNNSDD